jgi:hypothetical protein
MKIRGEDILQDILLPEKLAENETTLQFNQFWTVAEQL